MRRFNLRRNLRRTFRRLNLRKIEAMQTQEKKRKLIWIVSPLFILAAVLALFFFKAGFTVSRVFDWSEASNILPSSNDLPKLPEDDPDRLNVLLLGMRGSEDDGEGKFLSDTIILASVKKDTGKIALISLPRDLYVRMWCVPEKKKINFAYACGGLDCAKKTVSLVTGLFVDYAIVVDFRALQETVEALGGITIYRNEPFEESFQWAKEGWEEDEHWLIKEIDGEEKWVFYVPEGKSELDGQTTLYYARSRYSTNDFDRMRRQQQIILAIKEKALSLGVLANPVKVYNLMDILGDNVQTDMGLTAIKQTISMASGLDLDNIKKEVFDISPNGLLYHTFIDKEYVLLPIGDNFGRIKEVCQNIFNH